MSGMESTVQLQDRAVRVDLKRNVLHTRLSSLAHCVAMSGATLTRVMRYIATLDQPPTSLPPHSLSLSLSLAGSVP